MDHGRQGGLLSFITRDPLAPPHPLGIGQRPHPNMRVPDPLSWAPLRGDGLNLRAATFKPPPPQHPVDQKTGIAELRADTQMPSMPMTVTSDFDSPNVAKGMEATSSEVGSVGPEASHPIDRARIRRGPREWYR